MSQYNKVITLLDDSFAVYGDPIAAWESLAYSDAWDKHGTISLVASMDHFADLSGASWMEIDGRVYEVETITSEDADQTVKVTGCSLNVLFDRIIITEKERIQGRLEERIQYLVNKYAIIGKQAIAGLLGGGNKAYARAIDATTIQWQTLSEFLYTQLNQRGFTWDIDLLSNRMLEFSVTQSKDRTQDQTTNPPVQLSTTAEIEKATYKKSIKDFRNYAIVHDDDKTNPQVVHVDLSNGAAKRVLPVSGRAVGADDSAATNLYVMVGTYSTGVGYIATSTDGQSWTNRVITGILPQFCIEYQNGRFIAAGGGYIHTSTDGITWTSVLVAAGKSIEGVGYEDGIYLAFDSTGGTYYSYDAITWFNSTHDTTEKIVNAVYATKQFVAFSAGTSSVKKITSENGTIWKSESITVPGATYGSRLLRTCIKDDLIVSVGYGYDGATNTPLSIVSNDFGETVSVNSITSLSGKQFLDMAAGLGVFVAVGQSNLIAWSTDGVTWTDVHPAGGTPDYITVTFDGTLFHAYSFSTKHHAYSADGKVWTLTSFTTSAIGIDAVTYGTSSHSGNLYQVGLDALQASVVVEALDGDVNQELAPTYEIDYNIGDIIDTLDPVRNIAATKRVYSVDHIIDKDNDYAIVPKLGKDFLTLRQLIAKEIKNNGI